MRNYAWPLGITLVMAAFIAMTIGFVRVAFSERVDLVAPDYYYRDKLFSARLESEKALMKLGRAEISRTANGVNVQLPAAFAGKRVKGTLHFYSPLNPAEDFSVPVEFEGTTRAVSAALKPNQLWRVSLDFESGGAKYFLQNALP